MRLVGGKRPESWWLYALGGALMIGGPVWRELFISRYPIRPEVFVFPLAAAAIGAIVALCSRLVGGLLGTIIFGGLLFVFTDLQFDLHRRIFTAVLLAGCFGLALLFASRRATITALTLGAFYLSSFVRPAAAPRTRITATGAARSTSPLLVHIILDEQWGVGGLRAAGDTVTADFLSDFYLSRGFELFEAAYSRYALTGQSVPQALSLGRPLSFNPDTRTAEGTSYGKSMRHNPYFERLRNLGYDVRVHQSTFIDFCGEAEAAVLSCDVQSGNSIANIGFLGGSWSTRGKWSARYFLNTRSHVYARLNPEPVIWRRSVAGGGVAVMHRLTNAIAAHHEGGTAYFVHVLLPHGPVQMDAECRVLSDPSGGSGYPAHLSDSLWGAALRAYAGQVRCAHHLLARVIDAVDSTAGRNRAIVIVHSDHGSRMNRRPVPASLDERTADELNSTYASLLAVRRPNVAPALRREPTPIQDFIWELARSGFTGSPSGAWQHYLRSTPDSATAKEVVRPLAASDMLWARRPD